MTNKRGLYVTGTMRTCNNIVANQKAWLKATNGDRTNLKYFKNCEFEPMKLRKDQGDQEIIFMFPPDPLHINYLGPVNDALELLEKMYPIAQWSKSAHFRLFYVMMLMNVQTVLFVT